MMNKSNLIFVATILALTTLVIPGTQPACGEIIYNVTKLGMAANGVNNAGQVVGESALPNGDIHASRYSGGVMQDLGSLAGADAYAFMD